MCSQQPSLKNLTELQIPIQMQFNSTKDLCFPELPNEARKYITYFRCTIRDFLPPQSLKSLQFLFQLPLFSLMPMYVYTWIGIMFWGKNWMSRYRRNNINTFLSHQRLRNLRYDVLEMWVSSVIPSENHLEGYREHCTQTREWKTFHWRMSLCFEEKLC